MLIAFLLSLASAWALTGLVRHYAVKRSLMDIPNGRSSHSVPTPRGGGLAIILVLLPLLAWQWQLGWLGDSTLLALLAPTLLLALVGWLDDLWSLPAKARFAVQGIAALAGLLALQALPTLPLFGWQLPLDGWLLPLLLLVLLWLTNLYNFMDGIDGIAALEAISVLAGAALLLAGLGEAARSALLLLLCAPLVGFLVWNFPPARIFMGDVCSAPLGLLLGLLGVWLAAQTGLNLWAWLILLGVFVVDASWTLLVRMLSGQRWSQPHRSHSYQILARRCGGHRPVSLAVAAINLIWLLPWSWLAVRYPGAGLFCLLAACMPLGLVCYKVGAGKPES
ncbi:glycosyl transferase [Marinobacterium arenosum]|uniref:glycosyl transferase n=1 Tax=Marinobacterium arenosum TaxID=2862496 RepID=UPI001C97C5EC|nr:glycosyl transferase [Marinobacterium arenosum]MBY4676410.1 glycosyl transferase [Marinobacterium arenosum]